MAEAADKVVPIDIATPIDTLCMACDDDRCDFHVREFKRRPLGPMDVLIQMKYCGVCHSDLHKAANHNHKMGATVYPCVPGHELSGVAIAVGPKATKIKVGMHVGVGCIVDSCLECAPCLAGEEQHCKKKSVGTYQAEDKFGRAATYPAGGKTLGGYTSMMVCHEHFVIVIPKTYPLDCAGPVMCAGITMYDPLKKHGVSAGSRVGIVGLGGLGQMGVRLAKALGCVVTVISRSEAKKALAKSCGAANYVSSSDSAQMRAARGSLDLILNTVPRYHDFDQYLPLLTPRGQQVILGLHKGIGAGLVLGKLSSASKIVHSGIGGIRNTQEVIDLCDKHKICPKIKLCRASELNAVYGQLDDNKTGIRFVIDIENTLNSEEEKRCTAPPPTLLPFVSMSLPSIICEACRLLWCCKAQICCCQTQWCQCSSEGGYESKQEL